MNKDPERHTLVLDLDFKGNPYYEILWLGVRLQYVNPAEDWSVRVFEANMRLVKI